MAAAERVDTVVVGGGPAGLAAAYRLSVDRLPVVLLERDRVPGGLMRSIRHGPFVVDIGRKELYSRIPEVHHLWSEVLGSDYREYEHRFGILYHGHLIEASAAYEGLRRGMPWPMFVGAGAGLLWSWMRPGAVSTYEAYWHKTCGRRLTRIMAQGFWEKFVGTPWASMPPPPAPVAGLGKRVREMFSVGLSGSTPATAWRHPARGTGQICDALADRMVEHGGRLQCEAAVTHIRRTSHAVDSVAATVRGEEIVFRVRHLVWAAPPEHLARALGIGAAATRVPPAAPPTVVTGTLLVYLFLEERPRFPHAWIEVTCPKLRAGRITNYAAFNGDMIPDGFTALCVEFFCTKADPLHSLTDAELRDVALAECAGAGLIDAKACFDNLVLRLPHDNASTGWREWQTQERCRILQGCRELENLFVVNRPGTDRATSAGLRAAAAISLGDRSRFDVEENPAERVGPTGFDLIRARL